MKSWILAGTLAALVVAGVAATAHPGNAFPPSKKGSSSEPSTLGYVDLAQVTDKIKETTTWQTMTKKFDTDKAAYAKEIEDLTKTRYLSDKDQAELKNLKARPKPSAAEEKRMKELEALSDAMDKEAQTLAAVEKPTAEQSARIKELAELRKTALTNLQNETDKRSEKLRDLESELLKSMQDKVLTTVKGVAQGKNMTMVVDRQVILFGGEDLTADVLKKLGPDK